MAEGTCTIEGCERPLECREVCLMHYKRMRKSGELPNVRNRQSGPCSIEGCDKAAKRRGWCERHYQRWYTTGTTDDRVSVKSLPCTIDGCSSLIVARGLCSKHYCRWKRHGDPLLQTKREPGQGHLRPDGYIVVYRPDHPLATKRGAVYLHRAVLYDWIGPGPHPCHWCEMVLDWAELTADHVDWDKANNAPENLVPSCLPCNSVRICRSA